MPKIFVTRMLPERAMNLLFDAFGRDAIAIYPKDQVIERAELLEGVQGVDGLLPILTERIDKEVLDAAGPQLKIVANYAVGYNNIDVPEATKRGIVVTNTPGVLTETTADLTWALILGAARRIGEGERYLRAGRWVSWAPQLLLGTDVYEQTLGIFGLGRIGQAVARRARGFGMEILYHGPNRKTEAESELNARFVSLEELLSESDFVSLHCPLNDETRHSFGAKEFRAMKRTAIFVNTTRGPVVDEAALTEALHAGEIAGAGLDVFEKEPQVHPRLLECENALLIPHMGSGTLETRTRMAEIAATNLVEFLSGRNPPNCVNPDVLEG
jgi:glyoxylate reductase